MLDKFFDLVLPRRLQHYLFDRLYSYHKAMNVLNQHVVACYEQFLTVCGRGTTSIHVLQICRRLQHALAPCLTRRAGGCCTVAALVACKGGASIVTLT